MNVCGGFRMLARRLWIYSTGKSYLLVFFVLVLEVVEAEHAFQEESLTVILLILIHECNDLINMRLVISLL